jgi:acyl carrier protein
VEERIKKVMASVFNMDISEIDNDVSPDSIKTWDSLKHMTLVLSLEEEFGIRFKQEQIIDLLSFKLILMTLRELLAE